jgi:predicted ATPase
MSLTPTQSVIAPLMVGRDAQLAALDALIASVANGHGTTLLISGEAGIGKSRLLAVARERFRDLAGSDAFVLQGHCYEYDRMLPYAPLVGVLRAALQQARGLARFVARARELRVALTQFPDFEVDYVFDLA